MTTDSKKNIVKLILFGIISLLLIIAASAMMNPTKWFDEKLIQDRNSRTVQMMYRRQPESLHLLPDGSVERAGIYKF